MVLESKNTAGSQQPMWALLDASYNVVALLNQVGVVLEQYVWEPYGTVLTVDTLANPPPGNSVGHQGLFFYRFDDPTAEPFVTPDPASSLNPKGLYYNRNRWYSPHLGQFTTSDPNESGQIVLGVMARNGQAADSLNTAIDSYVRFGGGTNLYLYLGTNPILHSDAPGLMHDPFDEVDEETANLVGHRMYALGAINEGARIASIGLQTTVDIASGFLPGMGLYDAFKSVQVIANGGGGFWDAMNIAMAAFPVAKGLGNIVGLKSLFKARKYRVRGCNCFVAGTQIDTPDGPVPIQEVDIGDEVYTRDEKTPDGEVKVGRVTQVFRSVAPAILWVAFSTGEIAGMTPGHQVWTLEDGWTSAGRLEIGDSFIDAEGLAVEVVDIQLDPAETAVYNIEVSGTFTYFAEGVWVHNKSCPAILPLDRLHGGPLHQKLGQEQIGLIKRRGGTKIRWNQALVNTSGTKVSNLRPDIQYTQGGKIHIKEVLVTSGGNRESMFRDILGSALGSYEDVTP